jgi:meiotically up-regulated gene 157 (Mug157) protein
MFVSALVEAKLAASLPLIEDANLRTLFENAWPNTLDTTVFSHDGDLEERDHVKARPKTWVITGEPHLRTK